MPTGDDFGLQSGTATSIGAQARVPLYQGGLPSARIRQAQAIEGQTLEQRIGTERAVVATTRSAFADYQAAIDAINVERGRGQGQRTGARRRPRRK